MRDLGIPAPVPYGRLPGEASLRFSFRSDLPTDGQERDIVQRARSGDQQALGELYDLYFPRIYRYILARTGNPA